MRSIQILLLLLVAGGAQATRPLMDRIVVDGVEGEIIPARCCWMPLPPSTALAEARLAQQCSAIGGPVGRFALVDGRLWLEGLATCGGPLPLQQIYPELGERVLADWLDGEATVSLPPWCADAEGRQVPQRQWRMQLVAGKVVSMHPQDAGARCAAVE